MFNSVGSTFVLRVDIKLVPTQILAQEMKKNRPIKKSSNIMVGNSSS